MASATAMPELFTNLISTFIADSDMGLGAVIGSLMWNILGVASVSSLATKKVCMDIDRNVTGITSKLYTVARQDGLGTHNS